jgi:IS5 family transposase
MRSIQRNVMRIGRTARIKGERGRKALAVLCRKVLATTGRVTAQAKRFSGEIANGGTGSADFLKQASLASVKRERQTRARVFGRKHSRGRRIVSVFEPSTEVIRTGKANKPTEFGKMVKVQEAETRL